MRLLLLILILVAGHQAMAQCDPMAGECWSLAWDEGQGTSSDNQADHFVLWRRLTGTQMPWQAVGLTTVLNWPEGFYCGVCPVSVDPFSVSPCPVECRVTLPGTVALHWHSALETPAPVDGTLYDHTVQACNVAGCSDLAVNEDPTEFVTWRAGPLMCVVANVEVPCYPGDPLLPDAMAPAMAPPPAPRLWRANEYFEPAEMVSL